MVFSPVVSARLRSNQIHLTVKRFWHAKFFARTTGLADAIFKVIDIYEVYIDPATELPVKSIRNVHEGRYHRYNVVTFDHKTRSDSAILFSDRTGTHIAPKGIHDIISCFYYFRNHILPEGGKLKKGDIIELTTLVYRSALSNKTQVCGYGRCKD